MERADQIAAIRHQLRAERTPAGIAADRRAVCSGTAAMIAAAQLYGRQVTDVLVAWVEYAGVCAPCDIRCDPPAEPWLNAIFVAANIIGICRAIDMPIEREALGPAEALVATIENVLDHMPAGTFDEVVNALMPLTESGWRDISGAG